ncbi:basal cell adhesion molecule [Pelodytes ibericus]
MDTYDDDDDDNNNDDNNVCLGRRPEGYAHVIKPFLFENLNFNGTTIPYIHYPLSKVILSLVPGCICAVPVVVTPVIEVEFGKNARIQCKPSFSGSPKYTSEWFIVDENGDLGRITFFDNGRRITDPDTEYSGRAEVTSDLTLVIKDVHLTDEATYLCRVNAGSEGTGEARAQLKVYDAPEVPELILTSGILSVTESSASEIGTCISRNGYPAPAIEWYRNHEMLSPPIAKNSDLYMTSRTITESSGLFTVSSILFLRPTKQDSEAVFSCKVVYPMPGGDVRRLESQEINLTLHYYTENVHFEVLSPLPIKEGDDLIMRCSGDGFPPPSVIIYMLKDGNEKEVYSGGEGVLTVQNVSREYNGSFRCQAMDFDTPPEIPLTQELSLFVNYLNPVSLIPSDHMKAALGQDILLSCSGDGSEEPHLRWKKGEKTVFEGSRYRLRNISYSHSGVYTCEALAPSVPGLRKEKSITVTVDGPPQLELGNDMFEVASEGETVKLTCSALGHPQANITWIPSDLKGTQSVSGMRVASEVSVKVSPKLLNGISCIAKNDLGSKEKKFTLKIANLVISSTAPAQEQSGGSSTAIIAVVVCVLLLLLVVGLFYFLQKRGKLTCGGSEKKSLTPDPASAELAPELKSDKRAEQHGLMSSRGGSQSIERVEEVESVMYWTAACVLRSGTLVALNVSPTCGFLLSLLPALATNVAKEETKAKTWSANNYSERTDALRVLFCKSYDDQPENPWQNVSFGLIGIADELPIPPAIRPLGIVLGVVKLPCLTIP